MARQAEEAEDIEWNRYLQRSAARRGGLVSARLWVGAGGPAKENEGRGKSCGTKKEKEEEREGRPDLRIFEAARLQHVTRTLARYLRSRGEER